jgi:hypothetical protein
MRWPGVALLALLGACAHDVTVDGPPERVWASSRSLDNAATCIISALDARGRSGSNISPNVTHARRVVVPGRIYEIKPEAELAVNSEIYVVRLEKIDDHITRISLFARSPWKKELTRAVASCGKN